MHNRVPVTFTVGSLTFVILSYLSLEWAGGDGQDKRKFIQTHLVMAWAARLGLFLLLRIIREGKDRRFDKAKHDPKTFLIFWTLQGA